MVKISIGIPSYIGYWINNNSIGVFGVFVFDQNKGKISGRISDIYGDSTFKGHIGANQVYFEKEYEKDVLEKNPEAIKGKLIYEGRKTGSFYKGDYYSLDSESKGKFILEKTGKSKTLEFLVERIISKNKKL